MAQAEGANEGVDPAEVKVLSMAEYEAMVAELQELRPLRSRLRAIEGLVAGRRRPRVQQRFVGVQ